MERRIARLVVISGPDTGKTASFEDKLTIGRRPENALSLRDEHVSRFHALVERRDDDFYLENLSNKQRTLVDGHPVDGTIALNDYSAVMLGRTLLRFRLGAVDALDESTTPEMPVVRSATVPTSDLTPLPQVEEISPRSLHLVPLTEGPERESLDASDWAQLAKAGEHLRTLIATNRIISTELDLEKLFQRILDALFETYPAHRAAVLIGERGELGIRAVRVERGGPVAKEPHVSSTIAYRAFNDRVGVLTRDAGIDDRFDAHQSIVDQDIRSVICSPMMHGDDVLGVIYLDTLGIRHAFGEEDLKLLNAIASAAGGAVRNALLVQKLRDTAVDTIFRLAVAAEQRDDDTGYHIHRMADYAATLARALGQDDEYAETIRLAAPMHDVGKIGIPDAILKKPGRLTAEEYEIMKQHTVKGGEILANAQSELLQMAQSIALTHHEKFDGSGYPHGLAGDAIPLAGRIVAVADVFDAVTSRRVYKPAFALEKSLGILKDGRGQHFDPQVVDAFLGSLDEVMAIKEHYRSLEAAEEGGGAGYELGARLNAFRRPSVA